MINLELEPYVEKTYKIKAERPFTDDLETVVFRNPTSKKWFGILMQVNASKLGLTEDKRLSILNVKCNPMLICSIVKDKGIYPAYHMNKKHWVSIDIESANEQQLKILIDESYNLTSKRK